MFNIFRKKSSPKDMKPSSMPKGPCGEIVTSSIISLPHGFSTRQGGVSEGIFDSLNLGMNRGDDKEKVIENYHRFLNACRIDQEEFVCGKQVHGSEVLQVFREDAKKPYGYEELFEADGYVTNIPLVPLVIFTADCIPLLLADEDNEVVAAVHCGWRSTVADIEKNAIDKMLILGAQKDSIKASIGPAIEKCCFEVGEEVVMQAENLLGCSLNSLCEKKDNGKYMLDLKGVLKKRLLQLGLLESNIEIIKECTMCNPDKYWSHRYTNGERGSQANIIMLK